MLLSADPTLPCAAKTPVATGEKVLNGFAGEFKASETVGNVG